MENLIFDKWLEIDNRFSSYLKLAKKNNEEDMILLMLIKDKTSTNKEDIETKQLKVQGRTVTSLDGISVDFGTSYPIATPDGKVTITKQFMKAFLI